MSKAFHQCSSLDLNNFKTEKVEDMSCMFQGCLKLTSLDITNFNTKKVKNMWGMVAKLTSMTSLDLDNLDMSLVEDMSYMFWGNENMGQ